MTSPDLILHNATVYTVDATDSVHQAVAVKDGRVAAIGTSKDVLALASSSTRIVDLKGRAVIPGFVDSHPHMDGVGGQLIKPSFGVPASIDDVLEVIRAEVKRHKPGEWVLFNGLIGEPDVYRYPDAFKEKRWPTRHDLDKVAPDNPIYIEAPLMIARGAVLLNTAALKLLALTRDSKPRAKLEMDRDQAGDLTGLFFDSNFPKARPETFDANSLLTGPVLPTLGRDGSRRAVEAGMRAFNAAGVTAIYEGHGLPRGPQQAYVDLWNDHALTVRTYFVIMYPIPMYADQAAGDALIKETAWYASGPGFGDDMLRFGGLGFSVDGTMTFGTPLMREPYVGVNGQLWHGMQHTSDENFLGILKRTAKAGLRVQIKAAGSGAVDKILGMYEEINAESPITDKRWVIEHCQFPSLENMEACRRLGVIPTTTTNFIWNYGHVYVNYFGRDMANQAVPFRTWIDAGVPVAQSTDGRPFEPLFTFWQMLARKDGVTGDVYGLPEQKLTRQEALRLYTYNAARAAFWEDRIGSLEIGKYADLVVLSDDIMKMPEDEIPNTRVLATLLGGQPVHDTGIFSKL